MFEVTFEFDNDRMVLAICDDAYESIEQFLADFDKQEKWIKFVFEEEAYCFNKDRINYMKIIENKITT